MKSNGADQTAWMHIFSQTRCIIHFTEKKNQVVHSFAYALFGAKKVHDIHKVFFLCY